MQFIIAADHPSLPGHFPGRPVVPGVVLLERVIDAIGASHGEVPALRMPQVKFLKPLLPGQLAEVRLRGEAPHWRFQVLHQDQVLASGELVAASA
jgi:3-hydroxymyristoyl/3-hydroxydecanoyl-(acyl carrier protein) dehydratase